MRKRTLATTRRLAGRASTTFHMSPPADVSHRHWILAALWPMVAVSGLFVGFKILARARRRMRWWWDDYLMLMSWVGYSRRSR